jgi:hypothetical protein
MKKLTGKIPDGFLTRTTKHGLCWFLTTAAALATAKGSEGKADSDKRRTFRPPGAGEIMRAVKPGHPRLILNAKTLGDIRKWIDQDPVAARLHKKIIAEADDALDEPPPEYGLTDGRRMLKTSGAVLQRVSTLGYAFHMTGRKDYVQRAWKDLDAAAGFKDWNPSHFLDTATMACAFAIGYDWLFDQWTPAQRKQLREAIIKLGLEPAMATYGKKSGWHRVDYNWNQICNGGIAMSALAIAEDEPRTSSTIVAQAIASLPIAMKAYAPDGAGREGAGYWAYGCQYNILMLASLESALGTDFDLCWIDGFRQSGNYQIYMSGGDRMSFNFGDCNLFALSTAQHMWMGRKYGIPAYSLFRYNALRTGAAGGLWDLLWFDPSAREAEIPDLPLDRHFRGAECVSMRDSWMSDTGFIAAMQGGSNDWTHRHYDLGSFILEAGGVRWIIDTGKESETYQQHKNHTKRGDFYRVRAEGHNTLVFNPDAGPGQLPDAMTAFDSFVSKPEGASAKIDLSGAYAEDARSVIRTFELVRGKRFTVSDEIKCRKPADIWSYFHTEAEVELSSDKRQAALKQEGKSLLVNLMSPEGAVFEVLPAEPGPKSPKPEKQASNQNRSKLAIHLKEAKTASIKVVFTQ